MKEKTSICLIKSNDPNNIAKSYQPDAKQPNIKLYS